jgi:hypothetical protein
MKFFTENIRVRENLKGNQKQEEKILLTCEFCGKKIVRGTWNKKYRLINVCQQPPKRFFCSDQCKLNWIFKSEKQILT